MDLKCSLSHCILSLYYTNSNHGNTNSDVCHVFIDSDMISIIIYIEYRVNRVDMPEGPF